MNRGTDGLVDFIAQAVEKHANKEKDILNKGRCSDYPSYREHVGRCQAFELVLKDLHELAEKYMNEEYLEEV